MRSILFWWLLASMDREWWARYLDRYGSPFLVGTYDRGDNESRSVLERAFSYATRIGGLVVSDGTKVEIKESAAGNNGDAYARFIQLCNDEMSKLIVGQTLSASPSPTGELGGGTARLQESVRQDIRKFDARLLLQTLRLQLFRQYLDVNGFTGEVPLCTYGADSADELRATMSVVKEAYAAGLELEDAGVAQLNAKSGLSFRRRVSGPPVVVPSQFSADDSMTIVVRESPAEVARIVRDSLTASEIRTRITALSAG
jgi:phage gp29-like protein